MYRIRIHGRGGQGGKTAAHLMGEAAFLEGKHSQAFALYGAERRGAPVVSFIRIDDKPIYERGYIDDPDVFLILDDSLLKMGKEIGLTVGLNDGDYFIVNTCKKVVEPKGVKVVTVDATTIALEELRSNTTNTPMLGALIKETGAVKLSSLYKAMDTIFGRHHRDTLEANKRAVKRCYDAVDKI